VVVSGCNHSGLHNLADALEEQFPDRNVAALIGGLHLSGADDACMASSMDALERIAPAEVITLHCTGLRGYEAVRSRFGATRVRFGSAGESYALG